MRHSLFSMSAVIVALLSYGAFSADELEEIGSLVGGKAASSQQDVKELGRWTGLPGSVTSLAFSADEKTLAVGLKDQIQLLDIDSQSVTKTIELKSGQVRSIAFSPDGKLFATGSYQNSTLFDAVTGNVVRTFKGHRGYVTCVAFSPDGRSLATACEDEIARIFALEGETPAMILKGHAYPLSGIAWSPDGLQVATSAGDDTRPTKPGQVRIWEASSGMLKQQWELHRRAVTGVAFSPDGHFLLSSSLDEHVNVYDLMNDKPLGFFAGHSRPTNAVVVRPDGKTVFSISGGRAVGKNQLFAWEITTGEPLALLEPHAAKVMSLAMSRSGRLVATGGQDQSVALWDFSFLTGESSTSAEKKETSIETPVVTLNNPQVSTKDEAQIKAEPATKILRVGIIGLDTSHAPAFAKTLNANPPVAGAEGIRVVAAYPKGSPDIPSSVSRVPGYTEELKKLGVEIVDSIDELLTRVDAVLLETNDGRPHYEQLLPCLKAGKPTFIDKPIAASLSDSIAIFEASKKYDVPVFSSSSLRFGKTSLAVRGGSIGRVNRCETSSPANLEPSHPDLYWYGIHGVESLFTVMGTGCQSVVRGKTAEGKIEVTGKWAGDRVGIFREAGGYQGTAIGEKGESPVGSYDGYDPLVFEIVKFFRTGKPPVTPEETLEIYAFMEAADESKRQNGASITLESVMVKARVEAAKKIAELK